MQKIEFYCLTFQFKFYVNNFLLLYICNLLSTLRVDQVVLFYIKYVFFGYEGERWSVENRLSLPHAHTNHITRNNIIT